MDDNDQIPIEKVDLISSGYEWICPVCDFHNRVMGISEFVDCGSCGEWYEVGLVHHAYD